jgi:hypothetical protein
LAETLSARGFFADERLYAGVCTSMNVEMSALIERFAAIFNVASVSFPGLVVCGISYLYHRRRRLRVLGLGSGLDDAHHLVNVYRMSVN